MCKRGGSRHLGRLVRLLELEVELRQVLAETGLSPRLDSRLVVVDGFGVVVRADQRVPDLAGQDGCSSSFKMKVP